MNWLPLDTWIVVIAALASVACALPGCFLVLRKMSMMGDALSHAVLPGIAIAFLVTGSRASVTMFIGAVLAGVFTAVAISCLQRLGKVESGAAMGVVFTSLFALGLLLIRQAADHVDLDPNCVLYGAIELTPLDIALSFQFFGSILEIPRAAFLLSLIVGLNLLFVVFFYKELRITTFDPALAAALGFRPGLMHLLLMVLVAVTTVAVFEIVGSILVVAMLIVPPATALLLTNKLVLMIILSVVIAILSAALGHLGAITVPTWFGFEEASTAGMMATVTGLIFGIVFLRTLLVQIFYKVQK